MTAEGNTSTLLGYEARMCKLTELHEHPKNPRKHFPEEPMRLLIESVKADGVRVPLIGRPRLVGKGIDICAGHRRLFAARKAGIEEVPVLLKDMTDQEFLDTLIFENGPREDLHPLEETFGWRTWLDESLADVAALIRKTGLGRRTVYARLQTLEAIPEAQQACLDGKLKWNHLLEIARVRSASGQRAALRQCQPPEWNPAAEPPSVRDLRAWIKKNLHLDLAAAPFSRESSDLVPEAGSCVACPKRLGNAPDFDPAEDLADMCWDPGCFEVKVKAHVEQRIEERRAIHGDKLVLISEEPSRTATAGALGTDEYRKVPDNAVTFTPEARPALIVEALLTQDAGKEVFVVLNSLPATAPAPASAPPKAKKPAGKTKEERETAEREAREREESAEAEKRRLAEEEGARTRERDEKERRIEAEKNTRLAVLSAIFARVQWPPKPADLHFWLNGDLTLPDELDAAIRECGIDPERWGKGDVQKLSPANLARLNLLVAVADDFDYIALGHGCDLLNAAAKRWGVDPAKIRAQLAAKEAKPKGGTRKEVVAQLPALAAGSGAPAKKKAAPAAKKSAVKKAAKKGKAKK